VRQIPRGDQTRERATAETKARAGETPAVQALRPHFEAPQLPLQPLDTGALRPNYEAPQLPLPPLGTGAFFPHFEANQQLLKPLATGA